MKKYKDFMPSEESEIEDLRKMQGPPSEDIAEALANKKAWDDYYKNRDAMPRDEKAEAEIDQAAEDAIKAHKKNFKGSKKYDDALKDLSATYRKGVGKAKPLSGKGKPAKYSAGGSVRGHGKARGGKPCKIC